MSNFSDADKTRVMPRVEPADAPQGPPNQGPNRPNRLWLWIALGVLGGALLGGVIAWFMVASAAGNKPAVSGVATSTVEATSSAGSASTVPPSQTTAEDKPDAGPDVTPPGTPKITFPPTNYWLSPDDPKVEIKWTRVSDPSGVSYVLEISKWLGGGAGWSDAERTAPVKRQYLEHTVTGIKERFRIIAIDGAGNESDPGKYYFLVPASSASEAASLNAH